MGSNGPVRVPLERLGRPKANQPQVELRFTNEHGTTEVWMISTSALYFDALKGRVRLAYLDHGVDIRLANQSASIDRLTKHLKHDHEVLEGEGYAPCTYGTDDVAPTQD
jgi:hypothetical protein